jgi:dimethylhistidine N-methyltransferase
MLAASQLQTRFADDVRAGLGRSGQKELPSMYLYDELGSALFEAITLLPEYGLTRADERLLREHAAEIAGRLSKKIMVAELGSGSGRKTRYILEAVSRGNAVRYYPIDISRSALAACERELGSVADVRPVEESYLDGLRYAVSRRGRNQNALVLFLGSTIGNFGADDAVAFLSGLRSCLSPGDTLLLGVDLVKDIDTMLLAYDDPVGVTAAFNRNILARINRELDADFDLERFRHEARYDELEQRIEMHLRSTARQVVTIAGADLRVPFERNETIWTEASYKFRPEDLDLMALSTGFLPEHTWVDSEWPFAECLWRVKP